MKLSLNNARSSYELPTLGLKKYNNVDLTISQVNPYRFHKQAEKLLVVREREREQQLFNKFRMDDQPIH
jgi:L-rhamnose isomerase